MDGWVCYCATVTDAAPAGDQRVLLMATLATVWGLRLSYNFAIKGGYSGGEDYRWVIVQGWYPGWQFEVFNLLFICCYQMLLLLAIARPAADAAAAALSPTGASGLGPTDAVAAGLYLLLVLGEATADRQMFKFQTEKYRRKAAGEPLAEYSKGFIDTGLWSVSRHPNYFCEVHIWWAYYLFTVAAGLPPINVTIVGPILLTVLFVVPDGSLDLTEAISSRKYPLFAEYQRRVSKFYPWFPVAATTTKRD